MTGSPTGGPPGRGQERADAAFSAAAVRSSYDLVADDYAAAFAEDLARLPLDRMGMSTRTGPTVLI